jgi:hypothetical protein
MVLRSCDRTELVGRLAREATEILTQAWVGLCVGEATNKLRAGDPPSPSTLERNERSDRPAANSHDDLLAGSYPTEEVGCVVAQLSRGDLDRHATTVALL